MGSFHCPVAALGYKSIGCIECGLCMAQTKEERVAASEIIRNYLRNNHVGTADIKIKKIAVCGKGGAGKSTVSALLALALHEYGYKILLMDTDNSNMGLARKVDIHKPMINFMNLYNDGNEEAKQLASKDPLYFEDFSDKFILNKEDISVFGIGKIEDAFQGCACSNASMARNFMQNITPKDSEIVIADQDAGVECFGRGIEQGADTIIIVVEPSYDSIQLAKQIKYMSEGLGIRRIRAIISKTNNEDEKEYMLDMLANENIRFLGALDIDPTISVANLKGESLKNTKSFEEMCLLTKYLLDEAEMPRLKKIK